MSEETKRRGGRRKEFEERIGLPISSEMLSSLDQVVGPDESRLDVIRDAISREIRRRAKSKA